MGLNVLRAIHDMSAIWNVRYLEVSLYFTPCFSISIVNFEHAIAGWYTCWKLHGSYMIILVQNLMVTERFEICLIDHYAEF